MKHILATAALALLTCAASAQTQTVPSVELKTLDGQTVDIKAFADNDGQPVVISFWATWCKPCKRELNAINEVYEDWQDETGVKLIAVSIDDSRLSSRVKPEVDANAWDYEVLLDPNGDLKRAMGVNTIPHTFLVDGNGHVVWQHNSYAPGDEENLYELIQKLAKGETISH